MSDIVKIKCYHCTGPVVFGPGENTKKCIYCHRVNDRSMAPKELDQLCRASELRNNSLFSEAERIYDNMLGKNPYDYNALWGMVLAKYGVVFIERENTSKGKERVITCRKRVEQDIYKDKDFLDLLNCRIPQELSDQINADAETISKIQTKIREYEHEKWDVFICYKETDDKGNQTYDSVVAKNIYALLKLSGLKVFYAKETLKNKVGADYEALIFNAVRSAPAMIVLGTKKRYLTSTWVKSEWTRYLELRDAGELKKIFPVVSSTKDLPNELANTFEAAFINSRNDYSQLIDNIKSWIHIGPGPEPQPEKTDALKDKIEEGIGLYLDGRINEAQECFKKADLKGNDTAAYLLGIIYLNDIKDSKRAFDYFKKAADRENADAMYQLALMYEFGIGVNADLREAKYYYESASESGNYSVPLDFI